MGDHPSMKRKSGQPKATIGGIAVWPARGPAVGERYGASGRVPPPRLSARSAFRKQTFAGTCGNEEDAPTPAVRPTIAGSPFERAFCQQDAACVGHEPRIVPAVYVKPFVKGRRTTTMMPKQHCGRAPRFFPPSVRERDCKNPNV